MNNCGTTLNNLVIGEKASVTALASEGAIRRRLLDLGIIVGTEIEPLYKNPSGNPVAYLIRGTVIALRAETTEKILVSAL